MPKKQSSKTRQPRRKNITQAKLSNANTDDYSEEETQSVLKASKKLRSNVECSDLDSQGETQQFLNDSMADNDADDDCVRNVCVEYNPSQGTNEADEDSEGALERMLEEKANTREAGKEGYSDKEVYSDKELRALETLETVITRIEEYASCTRQRAYQIIDEYCGNLNAALHFAFHGTPQEGFVPWTPDDSDKVGSADEYVMNELVKKYGTYGISLREAYSVS